MNRTHLSDERLIELSLDGADRTSDAHLAECVACESRRAARTSLLADSALTLNAEADAAFSPERLARQHARIMQRVDQEGRPARVIAFPSTSVSTARVHRRPTRRWAAAGAVAAAFVVGILAGHLTQITQNLPVPDASATHLTMRPADTRPPFRTVAASLSDDELLGQIEAAVGSTGPESLRALDAVTPRAWDVR
jgi:hypothetical protein